METLYATGVTVNGETKKFEVITAPVIPLDPMATTIPKNWKPGGDCTVNCCNEDLVSLTIPIGVKTVYCDINKLMSLILPEGVVSVFCNDNNLKSLVLSDTIKTVFCENNHLESLIVPESCEILVCRNNNFEPINECFINPKTKYKVIKHNELEYSHDNFRGWKKTFKEICEKKGWIEVIQHFNL